MINDRSDVEQAERLTRRRARILPVLAVMFVFQQLSYFANPDRDPSRTVDHFRLSAWLLLSVVLLVLLTTGGAWFRKASVRALINDETSIAHRADALKWGFVAAMAACIALYFLSLFEPIGGREAIHLVMTAGIAFALVRFGMLERRAHRDG